MNKCIHIYTCTRSASTFCFVSYSFVGKTDSAAMIDAELLGDIPLLCVAMFKCWMLGLVAGLTAQVFVAGRTRHVRSMLCRVSLRWRYNTTKSFGRKIDAGRMWLSTSRSLPVQLLSSIHARIFSLSVHLVRISLSSRVDSALEARLSMLRWLHRLQIEQPKCPGLKTKTYPQSCTSCEFQNHQIHFKCMCPVTRSYKKVRMFS